MSRSWCTVVIGVSALVWAVAATGCREDTHCPDNQICIKRKLCVNPCEINNLCGDNSFCSSANHDFTCGCLQGHVPDARSATGCVPGRPSANPAAGRRRHHQNKNIKQIRSRPVATRWNEVKQVKKEAMDDSVNHGGCKDHCGPNTGCKLFNNIPFCGCRVGFMGNPYDRNQGCNRNSQVNFATCWEQDHQEDLNDDCIKFLGSQPRKNFTLVREQANWFEALRLCENENKMLAIIENRYHQEGLETYLIDLGFRGTLWLAGSDLKFTKRFQWVSGNTFNTVKYTNWQQKEPSGRNEHCVAMMERYDWGTLNCRQEHYFVCQDKTAGY